MTDFERPTCHICSKKIERNESHIGPPFVDIHRHMECLKKCKKCGGFYSDAIEHSNICGREPESK